MVEPHIQIDMQGSAVTPLKGKVASAKKFRRSSMLKQAAAICSPAVAAALRQQPVVSSASKPGVVPASPQAAQKVVKDMGAPEMPMKASTSAASSAAVPGRAAGQMPADTAVVQPTAATGQVAVAEGAQEVKKPPKKAARPPVPVFPPRPKVVPIALPPKLDEDNYEISEKDENSDEACEEPDRSHKHVPRWCSNYLETLATQSSLDPDSIFGNKVPRCDLDAIFSDEIYKKYSRQRPQRRRGSSGEWRKDRLRPQEIRDYKKKMGQTKPWKSPAASPAATGGC
jgi:hypothetical protein